MVKERLAQCLAAAVERARQEGAIPAEETPPIRLDVPPVPEMGDWSSDLAVVLSRQARQNPRALAEQLASHLELPEEMIDRVEVAPSGFLNFYLQPAWLAEVVSEIRALGEAYGRTEDLGQGRALQVEYVSAYPTGPLTVQHGRSAALGDALATLMEWVGYRVHREFYVNDTGSQMERFSKSLEARYLQAAGRADVRLPADGFQAQYVTELAEQIRSDVGDEYAALPADQRLAILAGLGRDAMMVRQRETLDRMGVHFDQWFLEHELHERGALERMLERLRSAGAVYEAEGALWFRASAYGDEEDRPLLRSTGMPTYLAADLAYHLGKFERGFERVIDVWGPHHREYVGRTRAGLTALGCSDESLDVVICQDVSLRVDGMVVEGSSPGNMLPLDEVLDQVGSSAARFLYLLKPAGEPLLLDLDAARSRGADNPYQAVLDSLERAGALAAGAEEAEPGVLARLAGEPERALMRKLADFPGEIRAAARELEPSRLVKYVCDLAGALDAVVSTAPERADGDSGRARAALLAAGCAGLRNALAALGITSPGS